MQTVKIHITGGDGFGWALDEYIHTFRAALPPHVQEVGLREADVVYSTWWRGLAQVGTEALVGKKVLCGLDNPFFHWITNPEFRAIKDIVGLWIAYSGEAMRQCESIGLPCRLFPQTLRSDLFHPLGSDAAALRQQLRARWGIPQDRYVIGNFQRDTEGGNLKMPKRQKAPEVFAEIMRELHQRKLPIHVLLAGPRRHWLKAKLTEYGVPFTYAGKDQLGDDLKTNLLSRADLNELYQALDLYLLPSRWEGGPYAVLEAAGTRCKILSTPVGLAGDVLVPKSLFRDIPAAVASAEADILHGHLSDTVDVQYQRVTENHTARSAAEHAAKILAAVPEIPVFLDLPDVVADAIPARQGTSLSDRIGRMIGRFLPVRSYGSKRVVSIFREYVKPPYGGGNQFMLALRAELQSRGIRVLNNQIGENIDGYIFDSLWFDKKLLNKLARLHKPKVVHRIDGPIYLYRGKDRHLDDEIFAANRALATTTVIQSLYTLQRIYDSGYQPVNPVVIRNAANPEIFNRTGKAPFRASGKIRIVSSSWSNNPLKGGDVYKWLDENLDWSRYEYWFYGRASQEFSNIRQFPAVPSQELASHLRQCDVYITASRNDPCSNALIEALTCGLPAVYLNSGGHPELAGTGGIGFDDPAEIPAALERMEAYYQSFQNCIDVYPMAEIADRYLACLYGE